MLSPAETNAVPGRSSRDMTSASPIRSPCGSPRTTSRSIASGSSSLSVRSTAPLYDLDNRPPLAPSMRYADLRLSNDQPRHRSRLLPRALRGRAAHGRGRAHEVPEVRRPDRANDLRAGLHDEEEHEGDDERREPEAARVQENGERGRGQVPRRPGGL